MTSTVRPTLSIDEVMAALELILPEYDFHMRKLPEDDTCITVPYDALRQIVTVLLGRFDLYHLSTITGVDNGEAVELLYHFWQGAGLTLRLVLPYSALTVQSIVGLIPGAAFYEREIMEMLGVAFEGHPDPQPLLLPDTWTGGWPLRREQ